MLRPLGLIADGLHKIRHRWPKDVRVAVKYLRGHSDLDPDDAFYFEGLGGGFVIRFRNNKAVFWCSGRRIYAVNAAAQRWTPGLETAPPRITEAAVVEVRPRSAGSENRGALGVKRLTSGQMTAFEEDLRSNPDSFRIHYALFTNYANRLSGETALPDCETAAVVEEGAKRHLLWLIKHRPDCICCSSVRSLVRGDDHEFLSKVRCLWREHIANDPKDPLILNYAAENIQDEDPELAVSLLEKAHNLDPKEPRWVLSLVRLYDSFVREMVTAKSKPFVGLALREADKAGAFLNRESRKLLRLPESDSDASAACTQAISKMIELQDLALRLEQDPRQRLSLLDDSAERAIIAKQWDKAEYYSIQLVEEHEATHRKGVMPYLVFVAHLRLGELALRKGDVEAAKSHMLQAVAEPIEWMMGFALPQQLLERGERDAVLEFLRRCLAYRKASLPLSARLNPWSGRRRIYDLPLLKQWIAAIERGKTPRLGMPWEWQSALEIDDPVE
jgi:hypothetical protein